MNNLTFLDTNFFSRWPVLNPGGWVIIKKVAISDLRIGDIILYRTDNQTVCHRLVKKSKDKEGIKLFTRSDNPSTSVELVTEKMYLGKAISVLKNGKVSSLDTRRRHLLNLTIVFFGRFINFLARAIWPLYRYVCQNSKRPNQK